MSSKFSKNIILTGFMGTGKSSTGKVLASKMGWEFIDTDQRIVEKAGLSIPEIFDKFGETYFRELEKKVIKEVTSRSHLVIATGGGAIIDIENYEVMRANGIIICLTAEEDEIVKRVDDSRPLLKGNRSERIRALMRERDTYYRRADFTVDTTGKSPYAVAEEIIDLLSLREDGKI